MLARKPWPHKFIVTPEPPEMKTRNICIFMLDYHHGERR